MSKFKLKQGDNLELLKKLPDNSIDSVVTDPPYGLSFMNKKWDYDVPSVELWKEVYRVLKPGGHLLSFGGTRTYHRMVVNIEDAGFEIRDQIMWLYGSGFPKSHNISKAIDKVEGNERKVIGKKIQRVDGTLRNKKTNGGFMKENVVTTDGDGYIDIEEPGSENSKRYNGFGTNLKPANEPICLARKPLSEKTIAKNVLKWGTGGINIDGCRVGYTSEVDKKSAKPGSLNATGENSMFGLKSGNEQNNEGRFPANIILECICDEVIKGEKGEIKKSGGSREDCKLSHEWGYKDIVRTNFTDKGDIHTNPMCPCRLLDEQTGVSKSTANQNYKWNNTDCDGNTFQSRGKYTPRNDSGGASRYFYQAKVSKKERNMGLDGFEEKDSSVNLRQQGGLPKAKTEYKVKNNHPTVKPVNLMAYLCRLITPPSGTILDPYMGSGSTGIAALLEGFNFVGMDLDEEYVKIAEARIKDYDSYRQFIKDFKINK